MADKKGSDTGPAGPSSVTGSTQGNFSSQGSYGRGPTGRGPVDQPNTYATNATRDRGSTGENQAASPEKAQEANEFGQKPRTRQQEKLATLDD